MKHVLLAAIALLLGIEPIAPQADTKVALRADTAKLPKTTFVPSLKARMDPDNNTLWCGSLKLAWDALVLAAGDRFQARRLDAFGKAMQRDPFGSSQLSPSSYVAVAGFDHKALVEEARTLIHERLGQGRDSLLDDLQDRAAFSYAYLEMTIAFPHEFEDLVETPFLFGDSKQDVESWGLVDYELSRKSQFDQMGQVRVLHHSGPTHFIVEILPHEEEHIVLARVPSRGTLFKTWKGVQARREAYAKLERRDRSALDWVGGETFRVPKLDFALSHRFPEVKTGIKGSPTADILQTLRVRLDHRGAKIKSSVILGARSDARPRQFQFDGPFLVAFLHGDSELPYAMLWIANGDLMIPRKTEPESR
jgi:hypothetical protein